MFRVIFLLSLLLLLLGSSFSQVYFSDNFENGLNQWLFSDWDTISTDFRSASHCISESPESNYLPNSNSTIMMMNTIDLTSTISPIITFWHKLSIADGIDGYDYGYVEISKDGGTTWSNLLTWNNVVYSSWSFAQADLMAYKAASVVIRFRLQADADSRVGDGWIIDDIEIKEKEISTIPYPFFDSFENGLDNWIFGPEWELTSNDFRSDEHAITESNTGNYDSYANSTIQLIKGIDLSASTSPVLSFWHKLGIADGIDQYDYGYVEISEDGGTTWSNLLLWNNIVYSSWSFAQADLSEYKTSTILIRFRLRSDYDPRIGDGWIIDDFAIHEKDILKMPFPFSDNFESGLQNWVYTPEWKETTQDFHSPLKAATESDTVKYKSNANSTLILLHPIDLSETNSPILRFWHRLNIIDGIDGYDYAYLEISDDGGTNWDVLLSWHNVNFSWSFAQADLSAYKTNPILIRFRLRADYDTRIGDGWVIDDVEIFDLSGNRAPLVETFAANPTSGVAPLNVSFDAQASDADGSISEYYWDFNGDGLNDDTTSTGSNSYTYTENGTFNATCRVTDDQGALSAPASVQINVYSAATRVVSVPDDSAAVNATFLLPIRINDVSGIAGAEFKLNYDPAILQASNVNTTSTTSGFTLTDSVSNGTVVISMARASGLAGGSGDFVNITFHVSVDAQPGQTAQLTFEQAALYDAETNPILSTTENGLFTVKLGGDSTTALKYIFIQPALDTLSSDQAVSYAAFGVDTDDHTVEIDVTWNYEPVFGTPGSINPLSGHSTVFTAAAAGDGRIVATFISATDTLADTAFVIVGNMKGDVNIDELINVPDAILCLQIAANILDPSRYQHWAANFNNDGLVNSADGIGILTESLRNLLPKTESSYRRFAGQSGAALIYTVEKFSKSSDLLSVPVYIENRTDVCGMDLTIDYNTSNFALVNISPGNPSSLLVNNIGKSKFSTVNLEGLLSENGEIARLFFQPKNKTANRINLSIKSVHLFDQKGNEINARMELNHADPIAVPLQYVLHQNYPNPFNPFTTIRYDIPGSGDVFLAIYNIKGQLIRTLVKDSKDAGTYTVTWEGDDNQGHMVSSGVYFYKIVFNNASWHDVKKMLFVK